MRASYFWRYRIFRNLLAHALEALAFPASSFDSRTEDVIAEAANDGGAKDLAGAQGEGFWVLDSPATASPRAAGCRGRPPFLRGWRPGSSCFGQASVKSAALRGPGCGSLGADAPRASQRASVSFGRGR